MKLHAFIFCWPGHLAAARRIRDALKPHVDRLTVLDSSEELEPTPPCEDWIKVDPAFYYGRTFQAALARFDGDVLLQVQADAIAGDWAGLAARCRALHASQQRIGIWSPEIDHTDWPTPIVRVFDVDVPGLTAVALTDCTVWSLTRRVVEFLQSLDYAHNNLGWGIDLAAASFCYQHELIAVRDAAAHVSHPRGTGYPREEATRQMETFMRTLPPAYRRQAAILYRAIGLNKWRLGRQAAREE